MNKNRQALVPLQTIQIRKLDENDTELTDTVVRLFAEGLGDGFITHEDIHASLRPNSQQVILVAFDGSALIAVARVCRLSHHEVTDYQMECIKNGSVFDCSSHSTGRMTSFVVQKLPATRNWFADF